MLPDNPKSKEKRMTLPTETGCLLKPINNSSTSRCPLAKDASTISYTTCLNSSSSFDSTQFALESIMPGIYLTKNFLAWSDENLRLHGFTHVITIDKHIQELYYPSIQLDINISSHSNNHYLYEDELPEQLCYDEELETIDLNFGEKVYLTTVLPNCYKAVKFIDRALSNGGTILVIDCNGGEQKCLTIIAAYLMYRNNYSFSDAFSRLKVFYTKADLDRFYISQLYEYEPILQVQRAQSRGHSCSRELHSAILKRKKFHDDHSEFLYPNPLTHYTNNSHDDITME